MLVALLLVTVTVLAGCGSSSTRSSPSPTGTSSVQSGSSSTGASPPTQQTSGRSEPPPAATILVGIPTLLPKSHIPKRYTCDGGDVPLPVQWSHIPSGTAKLAMFVVNLEPVEGRLFVHWAVAGLSPTSHGISAGRLPPGAVVGRNSFGNVGYSICPAKGTGEEHYIVRVVALPHPLAAKSGFDAETLYQEAKRSAKIVGVAGGIYTPS